MRITELVTELKKYKCAGNGSGQITEAHVLDGH